MPILQDSHVYVMYCSLSKSGRLICIRRSWEFRLAMLTSVRANVLLALVERPLDLSKCFFKDRLLGLRKMAVLLHEVAAGKLPLSCIIHHFCIISCVKPHYFRSAFLRSGFHSCPLPTETNSFPLVSRSSRIFLYFRWEELAFKG